MNGSVAGRRLFKDRREREALAADPSKLIRELESNLSRRIGLLEGEVAEQTRKMQETREHGTSPDVAEERFKQLLSAMETFWAQAPRQMPLLSAPASAVPEPAPVPAKAEASPAKKPKRLWMVAMAAAAVALSLATPELQRAWSRYMIVETMPVIQPKAPAAPAPAPPTVWSPKLANPLRRFQGPQIALDIPANVRAKVPAEARVQVIVAIDEQGNVTRAEVESMTGQGARLLTKEALQAALRSRFRPAREGKRAIQSQLVLTYLFKPDSAEF
jgi:TonB family protein